MDATSSQHDLSRLAANQPKEEFFLWGVELSRSRDQHVLKLDEDINEDEERHLLHLKQVCLGINALEGDRNVVEIHATDFSDKEQRQSSRGILDAARRRQRPGLCRGRDGRRDGAQ